MSRTGPTRARVVALGASLALAAGAFTLFFAQRQTGGLWVEFARSLLILMATFWLAWGASQAMLGLWPGRAVVPRRAEPKGRCVILVPVHEEDPRATFARNRARMSSRLNRLMPLSCWVTSKPW